MKMIRDIRLFKSAVENVDGNPLPDSIVFQERATYAVLKRIVMKLRENGFCLGDFDHLYINFTSCLVENGMAIAKRKVDTYHSWYRYCDVYVEESLLAQLHLPNKMDVVLELIKTVLVRLFATESFDEQCINSCVSAAMSEGEAILMQYKEKATANRKAIIYLRCLDDGYFWPLLRVVDHNGQTLFETDLPKTWDLMALGQVQVSLHRVVVKPKKNSLATRLPPVSFEY